MAIFCFCSGPLKAVLWFEPRFMCFALSNLWCLHPVSLYIMFKCKQVKFVSLCWKFLNNSSACYNFKDVSRQLQMTFRKKLCAANDRISSLLWQMVLAFWPQFNLCFANQLPVAWEYTFFLSQIFQSGHQFGTPSIFQQPSFGTHELWKRQISAFRAKSVGFGCWQVSIVVYKARSKQSFWNNFFLAMGQHNSTFQAISMSSAQSPQNGQLLPALAGKLDNLKGVGRVVAMGSVAIS